LGHDESLTTTMPNAEHKELSMVPFTIRRTATLAAVLFLTAFTFACSDHPDNGLITGTRAASSRSSRVFTQRERLGNPLVSEVMIRKARHHDHNTGIPSTDVAEFTGDLTGFVTGVAGLALSRRG